MCRIALLIVINFLPFLLWAQSSQKLSLDIQVEGRITPIPLSIGDHPELQSRNQPFYNSQDNLTGILFGLKIGHQLWNSNFDMGITWLGRYDHIIYENERLASDRISIDGFMSDFILDMGYNKSMKNYDMRVSCGIGLMNQGSQHTFSYQSSGSSTPVEVNDTFNYFAIVPKLEIGKNRIYGYISMVMVPNNDFMYQMPEMFMIPSLGIKYRFLTLEK